MIVRLIGQVRLKAWIQPGLTLAVMEFKVIHQWIVRVRVIGVDGATPDAVASHHGLNPVGLDLITMARRDSIELIDKMDFSSLVRPSIDLLRIGLRNNTDEKESKEEK